MLIAVVSAKNKLFGELAHALLTRLGSARERGRKEAWPEERIGRTGEERAHKTKNANPTIPLLTPHAGSHFPCVAGSSGVGAVSPGVSSLRISIPIPFSSPLIIRRVAVSTFPATSPSFDASAAGAGAGAGAAGSAGFAGSAAADGTV